MKIEGNNNPRGKNQQPGPCFTSPSPPTRTQPHDNDTLTLTSLIVIFFKHVVFFINNIIMHYIVHGSISSIPRYIDTAVTKPNPRFKPVPVYTAPVTGTV